MADIELDNLIIRDFKTSAGFQAAVESGEIGENDLNFTPFMPASIPLLTPIWLDHEANDMSWLRADAFSWHSGDVYMAVYEHLVDEYNSSQSIGSVVPGLQHGTDTIGDIIIEYYFADDGHKICLPDQESNLIALYEATGVAWYYILDEDNKRFKLPRTKWGFTGLRDSVGKYIAPGLPDHKHVVTMKKTSKSGNDTGTVWSYNEDMQGTGTVTTTNASASNVIYGASDTVQPPATQMYLYFYVGDFEQDAVEQTAGINAELFNKKIDLPTNKTQADVDFVIASQLPTEANGYTWYRLYKSGWLEAGGKLSGRAITFPRAFAVQPTVSIATADSATNCAVTTNIYNITTTGFSGHRTQIADSWHNWVVNMTGWWLAAGVSA